MPFTGDDHNLPAGTIVPNGTVSDAVTQHNAPFTDISDCLSTLSERVTGKEPIAFGTVALLIADSTRTYSNTTAGDYIRTRAEGFAYEVAASGASDHHVTTGGGLKLYVLPIDQGYYVSSFWNGAGDPTTAIQLAADTARDANARLIGIHGTYTVTDTIVLECDGDLSQMKIEADGSAVSPVVRFGTVSGAPTSYRKMMLPRVRNSTRVLNEWGVGVGIELANCNTCSLFVPSTTEFEVGLDCGGYNSGFAYNTSELGFIYSNKINVRISPKASAGWANQNTFIGGRLGFNTGDFTASGYVGTRQVLISKGSTSGGGPNNNTFITPSLESDLVEYMVEFNESASYNQFINGRYEGTANNVLFTTGTASGLTDNVFIGGYQVTQIDFTFSGAGTSRYNQVIGARSSDIEASGYAFNISNVSGGAEANPHIQGFNAGDNPMLKDASSTDWVYRIYANGISGKRSTDAYAQAFLDFQNGRLYFGAGAAPATTYFGRVGTSLQVNARFLPDADSTRDFGSSTLRWANGYITQVRPGAGAVIWTSGTGTPEAAVTAPIGSLFTRTDGGAATTLYVKESGAGNTGWVAK